VSRIIGVIPARYKSTRLEGKMLLPIGGKAMIQRVYEQASKATLLNDVFVATDDLRIAELVRGFGGKLLMTSELHPTGSDRVAEAVHDLDADFVLNIQGDQPFIDPCMIDELADAMFKHPAITMATLVKKIRKEDLRSPSVVKVVVGLNSNALYFSRSLIPYPISHENLIIYEHIGLYAYQKEFLKIYANLPMGRLECIESLEQLRVLEHGYPIFVVETKCTNPHFSGFGVDTQSELEKAEQLLVQHTMLSHNNRA
jgi:3-deoxy-manno-octulosonate cytidylyltransferase (CMP-KDO synthetase)